MKNGLINQASKVQDAGRNGDTILAHINPIEAKMLKEAGGSGTINPATGLMEFGFFTSIRNAFQTVAVVVGNYFLPGSSLVTSKLVSKDSQKQLGSTLGQIATMASGISGANAGNLGNYGKIFDAGVNSISNGMPGVSEWLTGAKDTVSSAFGGTSDAVGSAAGNAAKAGSATGNATIGSNAGGSSWDMLSSGNAQTTLAPPPATDYISQMQGVPTTAPPVTTPPPTPQPGLIDRATTWIGKNPVPALMVGQSVMSGIGGMATAEAQAEQARINRDAQLQMHTVQGGFANPNAVTLNDPNLVTDMGGRYIRGPSAGQYAPGRAPGLINAAR